MIIAINNPQFTDEKCQTKSDHFAVNCIPYLVSVPCNNAFQLFVNAKTQEGEATSVGESCNFISSQENMGVEYQLTQTAYLPKSCTQLDLQSMEATTLADLMISSTSLVNQTQTLRRGCKEGKILRRGTPRRSMDKEKQEYRNTN